MTKLRQVALGRHRWRGLLSVILVALLAALLSGTQPTRAETFDSGSTGADGDLILTTPGTIIFNPRSFNPPLDPEGDNIYNFRTITIGAGVTVRLLATYIDGPVVWLASGAVTIDGTIDLNGENGQPGVSLTSTGNGYRYPSVPGAGGYPGGIGASVTSPPQPGSGPGGGSSGGGCANHAISACGHQPYGNAYLVPLVGGSGGGGGYMSDPSYGFTGGSGGAGGGALLVASSTSISVSGVIQADAGSPGGAPFPSGGWGSAGAIRLVAPSIGGTGSLEAAGAGNSVGRIRLEAFQYPFTGRTNPTAGRGTPSGLYLDQTRQPAVRIVSVASANVPTIPTGSFSTPDVTINSNSAVTVTLQAHGIPLGTAVKLVVIPEVGGDQTLDSTPLAGTLEQSAATVTVTLPAGYVRLYVYGNWTP